MSPVEHCIFCEDGYIQLHATVTFVQTYSKIKMSYRVEIIDLSSRWFHGFRKKWIQIVGSKWVTPIKG